MDLPYYSRLDVGLKSVKYNNKKLNYYNNKKCGEKIGASPLILIS